MGLVSKLEKRDNGLIYTNKVYMEKGSEIPYALIDSKEVVRYCENILEGSKLRSLMEDRIVVLNEIQKEQLLNFCKVVSCEVEECHHWSFYNTNVATFKPRLENLKKTLGSDDE